jgi:hypothetical protein
VCDGGALLLTVVLLCQSCVKSHNKAILDSNSQSVQSSSLSLSSIHGKFTAQLRGDFLYVATAPIHRPNNLIKYSLCRNKLLYSMHYSGEEHAYMAN